MQKITSTLISFFCALFLFSNTSVQANALQVNFTVEGFKDTTAVVAYHFGDKQYVSDTLKVDNRGRTVFKKDSMPHGGIFMLVLPDGRYFEFLVTGEDSRFSMETKKSDYVKHMRVRGSEENKIFYEYLNFIHPKGREAERFRFRMDNASTDADRDKYREKIVGIEEEIRAFRRDLIRKNPNTFLANLLNAMEDPQVPPVPEGEDEQMFRYQYFKSNFWNNIDFSDKRLLRTPIFHRKLTQYLDRLVPQNPDSIIKAADYLVEKAKADRDVFRYVVVHITSTYERHKIMGMDAVFVHMVENYYTADQAFWMDEARLFRIQDRAKTLKPILIGQKADNIILQDTDGRVQNLFQVESKYTVLYFWDPDCGHCRRATPKLKDMYEELNPHGVEVFAVTTERELDKWRKYVEEKELPWINVADPNFRSNFRNHYDINSTPVIFLLDSDKKIVAKNLGVEQLHGFLKRLLEIE